MSNLQMCHDCDLLQPSPMHSQVLSIIPESSAPCLSPLGLLKFSSEPRFKPEPGELNSRFRFGSGSVLPLSCRFWFWFGAPALSAELVLNWFEPEPDRV